ncbi:hypothetical protein PENSPDRAFT_679696 [Peniophora sp. CONT]|nr:hypothetical protein PENSPDRAFT_679696 [Peniophora sp. CONT]
MPAPVSPTYPSFTLVITEAFFAARPPQVSRQTDGLPLPSRYEPYPRTAPRVDDSLMTTVDYRWSPPPTTSYHFTPNHTMMDVDNLDTESDESHFLAVYNLDAAVRGFNREDKTLLARRPSLSTIVIDLALLLRARCKRLLAPVSTKPSRSTSST